MTSKLRSFGIVLGAAQAGLAVPGCGGGAEADVAPVTARTSLTDVVLAPTTTSAVPGQDFYDAAGRRWVCRGKVVFHTMDADAINNRPPSVVGPAAPQASEPTLEELAQQLRPVRLVGEYEYQLEAPDYLVAEKILAAKAQGILPPETFAHIASGTDDGATAGSDTGVTPKYVIGLIDDRYPTSNAAAFTGSATGHLSQNCSFAMIGTSTALSAAHCFYQNGQWVAGGLAALGANNFGPAMGNNTTPFGTFYADSLTLPGAWATTGGSVGGQGTYNSHSGWDWDFAVLEFSPTRYPGWSTSWYGTRNTSQGLHYIMGYPTDKLYRSQWSASGYMSQASGSRYEHYIDIFNGDSGACSREYGTGSWRCTGIQSSQWDDPYGGQWNEVRAWDSTTYNFFDTYGNWP